MMAAASNNGGSPGRGSDTQPSAAAEPVLAVDAYPAMLFDMDGVITRSADCHGLFWKRVFDDFLQAFSARNTLPFRPFDAIADYHDHVDGRGRYDGVACFLASRGIVIPFGEPTDDATTETCCGLGNRKNQLFLEHLERTGPEVFPTTVALLRSLKARNRRLALVSASKNAETVLRRAGLFELFDALVSGREAAALSLAGKPAPDTYLKAVELLGTTAADSVVFEDTVTGVQAAKTAGAGLIVGVDRAHDRSALLWHGADIVVDDLGDLILR